MDKLDALLHVHQEALRLRMRRQEVLASNIANADTPNYKARDMDFSSALAAAVADASRAAPGQVARTDTRHLSGTGPAGGGEAVMYRVPAQMSLDGNSVEMDVERSKFADNATRIEASITFLNGKLRTLLAAIQGQ